MENCIFYNMQHIVAPNSSAQHACTSLHAFMHELAYSLANSPCMINEIFIFPLETWNLSRKKNRMKETPTQHKPRNVWMAVEWSVMSLTSLLLLATNERNRTCSYEASHFSPRKKKKGKSNQIIFTIYGEPRKNVGLALALNHN